MNFRWYQNQSSLGVNMLSYQTSLKVHYEGDFTLNEEFEVHTLQPAEYKSMSTVLLLMRVTEYSLVLGRPLPK